MLIETLPDRNIKNSKWNIATHEKNNLPWPRRIPTVRTRQKTRDWFKIGKWVRQGYILSPCLFNLYVECIMRNSGLDVAQAEIKNARRNINNLRCADDTTLLAETKEVLKSFLMKVKQKSEKTGLKLNIQKTKIIASGPITSWQTDSGKNGSSDRLYFLGLQNHCRWCMQPWNSKMLAPWKKSYDKSRQCIIKQRHYFANKGPSNKSYGFSSSHMRLWESDSKEGWAPKKWCFWTVVLEKTLESPLSLEDRDQISQS